MYEIREVTGATGGECYLVLADKDAVLLDSGFDFCSQRTIERIRENLGGRELQAILLSHSHYDHANGAAAIKAAWPKAMIAAHPHAGDIISRPGARDLMRSLDKKAASMSGAAAPGYDDIDKLSVDITPADGDVLSFGDIRVQMLAAPGHTRCSVDWYFPDDSLVYTSESLGVAPLYPEVVPCFIIGYGMSLEAIEKTKGIGAQRILPPHSGVIQEGYPGEFFDKAREAAEMLKEFVVSRHIKGMDDGEICEEIKHELYLPKYTEVQPEAAFMLNMQAMVPRLLAELEIE